jgi:hypothetical protein
MLSSLLLTDGAVLYWVGLGLIIWIGAAFLLIGTWLLLGLAHERRLRRHALRQSTRQAERFVARMLGGESDGDRIV